MADSTIPEHLRDYASAGLRWSLLLDDHPMATRKFREVKGSELGEPFKTRWPNNLYIECAITIPGHGEVHVGYKELPDRVPRKNSGMVPNPAFTSWDEYTKEQTKACGAACRDAGYPSKTPDLKLVLLWRRRMAEAESLAKAIDAAAGGGDDEHDEDETASGGTGSVGETDSNRPTSDQRNGSPEPPPSVGQTTSDHVAGQTSSVLAPILADDEIRSLWDQLTDAGKTEVTDWASAQSNLRAVSTKAWIKHVLEKHAKTSSSSAPAEDNRVEDVPTDEPPAGPKDDWVTEAIATLDGSKVKYHEPRTEADNDFIEAVREVRTKLEEVKARNLDAWNLICDELRKAGVPLDARITLEQLMKADDIITAFMTEGELPVG